MMNLEIMVLVLKAKESEVNAPELSSRDEA
jgi:hypothetical protein